MIYYFDTSALVKLYHREQGTERVVPIYLGDEVIYISELSRLEFIATVFRKYREHAITRDTLHALMAKLQDDQEHRYEILKFSSVVIDEADHLLRRIGGQYGLKTLDSLQLAFLTAYCEPDTKFVCSDRTLGRIVADEGFEVIIPEQSEKIAETERELG